MLCSDDVVCQPSKHLPNGDSLYLPSSHGSPSVDELAKLYCGISKDRRKKYNEFMKKFIDAYGYRSDWPARVEESEVLNFSEVDTRTWDQPINLELMG